MNNFSGPQFAYLEKNDRSFWFVPEAVAVMEKCLVSLVPFGYSTECYALAKGKLLLSRVGYYRSCPSGSFSLIFFSCVSEVNCSQLN